MFKGKLIISDEKRVTIYVWRNSKTRIAGHVSLKTYGANGIYASFWPRCDKAHVNRPDLCQQREPHFHDKDMDDLVERGPPEYEVDLYDLDVNAIHKAYAQLKSSLYHWSLWGSSIFVDLEKGKKCCGVRHLRISNCAGLVEYLLNKGGIYDTIRHATDLGPRRINWGYSSMVSSLTIAALLGAYTNGLKGAAVFSVVILVNMLFITCIPMPIAGDQKEYPKENTPKGVDNSIHGAMSGIIHFFIMFGIAKGIVMGGHYGESLGYYSNFLGATMGGIMGFFLGFIAGCPISLLIGPITGFLAEGTGLFTSPAGVENLVSYAKSAEKNFNSRLILKPTTLWVGTLWFLMAALMSIGTVYTLISQINSTSAIINDHESSTESLIPSF